MKPPQKLPRARTGPQGGGAEMKFGEQLENEMVAAGLVGDKLPWINYGCVVGDNNFLCCFSP
jgi:hypothetical protein